MRYYPDPQFRNAFHSRRARRKWNNWVRRYFGKYHGIFKFVKGRLIHTDYEPS